jgi:hypothetical protein
MNKDLQTPLPESVYEARKLIAELTAQLEQRDILLRDPPDEPTGCCGSGCIGCVWESYYLAVVHWCDHAKKVLREHD